MLIIDDESKLEKSISFIYRKFLSHLSTEKKLAKEFTSLEK